MNNQPIEKYVEHKDGKLDVHSIFKTIQGEGPLSGTPAVFVRLAGCCLQCPMCDTDYTSGRQLMDVESIYDKINTLHKSPYLVVITGGEPFRQDIGRLIDTLWLNGYYIQIETNGTLPPSRLHETVYNTISNSIIRRPLIVCSPKTGKIDPEIMKCAYAFKYVIKHNSIKLEDGLPLNHLDHSANPWPARPSVDWTGLIYIQPEDSGDTEQNKLNMQQTVKSCLEHGYIMQLQIHKIIGVE